MSQIWQEINLEQQQKIYMTTELRQAISILQMTALELNEYIVRKIEENPFLDEVPEYSKDDNADKNTSRVNIDDILDHLHTNSNTKQDGIERLKANSFENYLSDKTTLYQHLQYQLHFELRNPTELIIGDYLIGNIDNNGYLCLDLTDVAQKLNVNINKVEEVLKTIHSFNPPGIGARNLQECLQLQLQSKRIDDGLTKEIIKNYLNEIGEKKLNKIANELTVDVHAVQKAYDLIRTLDPKPGLQYGAERNPFVWPDVTVMKNEGKYTVSVNDLDLSYLKINRVYIDLFKNNAYLSEDARKYLKEKLESALGLIRGIEQRRMNIYKVVQCIVNIQSDFLDRGIEYLKPLTMSKVAELVNIHESTVSRVTCNKYVQTPRGLFALKYFFNSGLASGCSKKVSSASIKYLIREIISSEDSADPLSDQKIMDILVHKGISISRRTVNKYRQSMGIQSNLLRKRY